MMVEDSQSTDLDPVFDPDTGAYHVQYEPTGGASLEFAVISAVAAIAGVRETALDGVLYDHVDPDALDVLFERNQTASAGVWFTIAGRWVVVRADGDIAIYPPETEHLSVPLGPDPGA